jgi:L-lactate dehydrogenase
MAGPKVFIIGAGGMVGATAASALAIKETVHEIVLIDVAEGLVHAHATDINHATAYTAGVHVRKGDYVDIEENDIIVITCGVPQKPGQPRLELLETNAKIMKEVVGKIMQQGKLVTIIVVSNPVDVLTYVALKESGLPKERVFGTGTTLDTARLRVTLANMLGASQKQVQGYVLGEHGDSSFTAISTLNIAGVPLTNFPGFTKAMTDTLEQDIRDSVYKIIAGGTASKYGIGHVIVQLVEALMQRTHSVFPVCSLVEGEYGLNDVVVGLPSLVSHQGATIIDNYPLTAEEEKKLNISADIVKDAIKSLGYLEATDSNAPLGRAAKAKAPNSAVL